MFINDDMSSVSKIRPLYSRCYRPLLTPLPLAEEDPLHSLANELVRRTNKVPNLWVDGSMLTAMLPAQIFRSKVITDKRHFRLDDNGQLKYYDRVQNESINFKLVDRAFEDFDDSEVIFGLRH